MPGWVDIIFVVLLIVVLPVANAFSWPQIKLRLLAQQEGLHEQVYRSAIISQWLFVGILLVYWNWQGRDFFLLGLQPGDLELGLSIIAGAIIYLLLLNVLWLRCAHVPELRMRVLRLLENSPGIEVTPVKASQLRWWFPLSLTAGICEEILFRGFSLWVLSAWMDPWFALFISSLFFGIAHSYQGKLGMMMTGLVGFVLGAIFLSTHSLLAAIVVHAIIDYGHGKLAYQVRFGNR